MSDAREPTRGARLLLLPRRDDHLKEGEDFVPFLTVDGPVAQARQPQFKVEAYGLFHTVVAACETLAEQTVPAEHTSLGAKSRRTGIRTESLVGARTHMIQRRNGATVYARLALEDEYVLCLVVPRLPVAQMGASLLDAIVAVAYSSNDGVVSPDARDAPPCTSSIKAALAAPEAKAALHARLARVLAWVEQLLHFGPATPGDVDAEKLRLSEAPLRVISRWGCAGPEVADEATATDEAIQAAAHHWVLAAACLHRPLQESTVAFSTSDAAPRWAMLGGAVYHNGRAVDNTLPSASLARAVAFLALHHGFLSGQAPRSALVDIDKLDAERAGGSTASPVSAGTRLASLMTLDVSALLDEVERDENVAASSALLHGGPPAGSSGGGQLCPPYHAPGRRALLVLAGKGSMGMACVFVPSVQPYNGTHIDAARVVMAHAVEHLAQSTANGSASGAAAPCRILGRAGGNGSVLRDLVTNHQVHVLSAAAVSPSRDLQWFETVDAAIFLDSAVRALVDRTNKNVNSERASKVAQAAAAPIQLNRTGLVALLHGTASECIRTSYRSAHSTPFDAGGSTTVMELVPGGPMAPGRAADEEFDGLLAASGNNTSRKKRVLERERKLTNHPTAIGLNASTSALDAEHTRYFVGICVYVEHSAADASEASQTEKLAAVSCLVRIPRTHDRASSLSLTCAAVRALARVS